MLLPGPAQITAGTAAVGNGNFLVPLSQPGNLAIGVGVSRVLMPAIATIVSVVISCGTSPGGQSIIVDVNKNGSTIFTTTANRPAIAAGANATPAPAIPDLTALALGDYFTVDIAQVGTSPAGADLFIGVYMHF